MNEQHSNHAGATNGVEPDILPLTKLAIWTVILTISVGASIFGVWRFYKYAVAEEVYDKELSKPNSVLAEVRAKGQQKLSNYEQVDAKKNIYRLPISRAMDLLVTNPALLDQMGAFGGVPAGTAPNSQPTSAPTKAAKGP